MILVTVQFIDADNQRNNGGTSIHFYNLNEAKLFAQNESSIYPTAGGQTPALCKVYNDGVIVEVWQNGINITE